MKQRIPLQRKKNINSHSKTARKEKSNYKTIKSNYQNGGSKSLPRNCYSKHKWLNSSIKDTE